MGGGTPKIVKNIEDSVRSAGSNIEDTVRHAGSNLEDYAKKNLAFANVSGNAFGQDRNDNNSNPELTPEVPDPIVAGEKANKGISSRRRNVARSRSVFTNPLGLGRQGNMIRNFLTGQ